MLSSLSGVWTVDETKAGGCIFIEVYLDFCKILKISQDLEMTSPTMWVAADGMNSRGRSTSQRRQVRLPV
jgi:hypothetical protein